MNMKRTGNSKWFLPLFSQRPSIVYMNKEPAVLNLYLLINQETDDRECFSRAVEMASALIGCDTRSYKAFCGEAPIPLPRGTSTDEIAWQALKIRWFLECGEGRNEAIYAF